MNRSLVDWTGALLATCRAPPPSSFCVSLFLSFSFYLNRFEIYPGTGAEE